MLITPTRAIVYKGNEYFAGKEVEVDEDFLKAVDPKDYVEVPRAGAEDDRPKKVKGQADKQVKNQD
ncbi:MAG: hypothetical protein E6R04_11920 [Spirochaetes bacterium]|nr:MAG: hypothetical protein E6R04_11920 [Spirochaetota bacterium]